MFNKRWYRVPSAADRELHMQRPFVWQVGQGRNRHALLLPLPTGQRRGRRASFAAPLHFRSLKATAAGRGVSAVRHHHERVSNLKPKP